MASQPLRLLVMSNIIVFLYYHAYTPLDEWEMDESHEFMTTLSSEPAEDTDSEVSAITFNKFHFL